MSIFTCIAQTLLMTLEHSKSEPVILNPGARLPGGLSLDQWLEIKSLDSKSCRMWSP